MTPGQEEVQSSRFHEIGNRSESKPVQRPPVSELAPEKTAKQGKAIPSCLRPWKDLAFSFPRSVCPWKQAKKEWESRQSLLSKASMPVCPYDL